MSSFIALPKGVTEETVAKAIKEYRALLGGDRVRTDPACLQSYMKIMIPESEELHKPSAAMYPRTVKEIQAVVAIAKRALNHNNILVPGKSGIDLDIPP